MILVHVVDLALRVELFEKSLFLPLAVTDVESISCVLFVIEDFYLVWQLIVVGTLDVAISLLVRSPCDSIRICLHDFLARA